ncbi:MAG: hypothetical protein ACOY5Y_07190 [Pseudomonadota bacterium]
MPDRLPLRRPRLRGDDRAALASVLLPLAGAGFSAAQAAARLGVTRNTVIGVARDYGVAFAGAQVPGPGCDPAAARRGWATRRARGWTPAAPRHRVNHLEGLR